MAETSDSATKELFEGLNPEQIEAVRLVAGPVVIRAGAGTGKTTTVSRRIAYGVASEAYRQQRVLALTYTNRAAAELRSRLRELGLGRIAVRTMHSAALAQLQYFWPQLTGKSIPQLLTDKSGAMQVAYRTVIGKTPKANQSQSLVAELEWSKYSLTGVEGWSTELRRLPVGLDETQLRATLAEYERSKTEQGQIDWDDVLVLCLGMLLEQPRALDEVRQQYRHFTIDEYQDFSPLQQALLELWLGERSDICVVGDERQAIFGFSGATPDYLIRFRDAHPEAFEVELVRNYRSGTAIVSLANSVLDRQPIVAARQAPGTLVRLQTESSISEAAAVSARIARSIASGIEPAAIAILARTNAQLADVTAALATAEIPTQANSGTGYWQQPEVKQCLLMLRALQGKSDAEPLFVELHSVLTTLGWQPSPPDIDRDRWDRLDWFNRIFEELGENPTLEEFLRELTERQQGNQEPRRPAVTISTIHAAKGLEWDEVYLVGACDGKFPHPMATTAELLAEERRLLYVAVTRARNTFVVAHPGAIAANFRDIIGLVPLA